MAESAVRFFVPDHPALARTLAGKLRKAITEQAEQIVTNYAQDWADYKYRCGLLKGLQHALEECEAAEKEMNE